jgi:transposase
MSSYVPAVDRKQIVLFPDALDDYVAADNPVRVIDAFVDHLDMAALGFARATPADTGRPGYDPRTLLKLYLYGYLYRIRSSRRLERETQRNVEVMWVLGRLSPDHKTISDFRGAHATALRHVFRAFTVVCRRLDLFGAEFVGIDGSKLRAVNAKDRSFTPGELRALLKRIDARIAAYLAALKAADRPDPEATPAASAPTGLREKLEQLTTRQAEYHGLLADLEATGATQVTLTDPESRRMKVKQGTEVCYNAQLAVDAKHHLVVTADVTNEVTDIHQLSPMALAAKAELGVEQLDVVADAGYHNGPEVARCVDAGITPTIPRPRSSKNARAGRFTKEDFQYLPTEDAYRCPNNAVLPFQFATSRRGQPQRYYYHFAACAQCPVRAQCTRTTSPHHGRRITRWNQEHLLEQMEARLRTDPHSMVRRKSLVEHPFGTIKRWDDGSYFLLRGLTKVRGEFSLMALAYNLRRALRVVGVPKLLSALSPPDGRGLQLAPY